MRKYILFQAEINEENTNALLNEIDESGGNATLFFSTPGGTCFCSDIITAKLNDYPGIDIVFIYELCSAGLDLIFKCKNHMSIGNYFAYGMMHKTEIYLGIESTNHSGSKDKIVKDDLERIRLQDKWCADQILTKPQMKKYESNSEVYLTRTQIQKAIDLRIAHIDTKTN